MLCPPGGPYNSAADTPSPVYPDRLIRPLPKRTLRSRLSSETAESIFYPPAPPATQLFYGACADNAGINDSKVYVQPTCDAEVHDPSCEFEGHAYENGVEFESGDEDGPVVVRRSAGFRGSPLSAPASSAPQGLPASNGLQLKQSAGPDGYDAFENTNNKKKRKIPTPGNLGGHHTAFSPELASMGLASSTSPPAVSDGNNVGTYYGTGNPASPVGNGISGSGRGRLGRHGGRSGSGRPLSVNSWTNCRAGRREGLLPGISASFFPFGLHSHTAGDSLGKSDQGIISTAIANAAALSSPPKGPGNVSLLEKENTPTKTQFTFTCESDSSKGMALQAQHTYPVQHRSPTSFSAAQNRGSATQGTQTSPNMAQMNQNSQQPQQAAQPAGRKKKRSPGSVYALAARQRRIQQQYANLHHPPSLEDIWICEFCEYESIFGHPPEALIRQYERKDRQERKRLAEKRRLLEKAKMKGRKNKKATKNAAKNAPPHTCQQGYDRAPDQSSMGEPGLHEDDYLDNEYEGSVAAPGPAPPGPAPPGTFKTPLPAESQPKAGFNTKDAVGGRPP